MADYYATHGGGPRPKQKQPTQAPKQHQAEAQKLKPAASTLSGGESGSCSDITGTGGGSSPGNCTRSNGVPPNVQAQINQAQSYMQAAKTVKESDPSYNGWSTAAQQFHKAEAAFKAAGDLANAAAAAEQAQTLENALKIADAKSNAGSATNVSQPAGQPNARPADQASKSCPPLGPASYWQNTPNAFYCEHANCVERGSAYYGMMCFPQDQASSPKPQPPQQQQAAVQPQQPQAVGPIPDVNSLRAQQGSCSDITGLGGGGPTNCQSSGGQRAPQATTLANAGPGQTVSQSRPPSPSAVTPNFSNAIQSLADVVADNADDNELANRLRRRLERTLADHHVPLKSQDYACLQSVSAASGKPKLIDVPLQWTEYDIKHEAIARLHLCDNAADGDAKEICREQKFGQAVMWAEPELAGLCRADGGPDHDIDKVAECAKRKFLNARATNEGIVQEAPPDGWSPRADCAASTPPDKRKQAFRSHLRELLTAALAAGDNAAADAQGSDGGSGANDQAIAPPSPPPAVAPSSDDDEAYCSYMARQVVRGELTPGAGAPIPPQCKAAIAAAEQVRKQQQASNVPPFSMSDVDTDKEIKQLMGIPSVHSQ